MPLSVVLAEDLSSLSEVVVVGYGTQQRRDNHVRWYDSL
jgi:hypothetical protein